MKRSRHRVPWLQLAAFGDAPLETTVFIELLRRDCEIHYIRTPQGHEVDFHALLPDGEVSLIQVCADPADPGTFNRKTRALIEASNWMPQANPLLITLDPLPPGTDLPGHIETTTAAQWLLNSFQ